MKNEGKFKLLVCLGIFQGVLGASLAGFGLAAVEHGHGSGGLLYAFGLLITIANAIPFMSAADIMVQWKEDFYKTRNEGEKSG